MLRLCAVKPDYHRRWLTFIEYLIAGFFQLYCEWERQPRLQHHLVFVNQESAYRALHLVCHAYLHMAFDLPRTTADSFGAVPLIPLPGVPRAKAAYLSLEPGFKQVARRSFRKVSRVGCSAAIGVLPILGRSSADIFSYWVLHLRSDALLHADILSAPPPGVTRQQLEKKITDVSYY